MSDLSPERRLRFVSFIPTSWRRPVFALLALALAVLAGACSRRTSEEKALMQRLEGVWVWRNPGSVYETVEELRMKSNGEYTRRTYALVRGKERRIFIKRFTLETELEPASADEVQKLEKAGFRPWIETGRYTVKREPERGTTIAFEPQEQLSARAQEAGSRAQELKIAKNNDSIIIQNRFYKREQVGAQTP